MEYLPLFVPGSHVMLSVNHAVSGKSVLVLECLYAFTMA